MATKREPRFKQCRRFGINIYGHPKALKRVAANEKSNLKQSEYGIQLIEKQKLKAYYGVLEKQFRRYVKLSMKSKDTSGKVLLKLLESRLDNMVYRIGFASSIRQARQMVNHGLILVNGEKVNIPSYEVKINDVVSLKEKYRKNQGFVNNFTELKSFKLSYIEKDFDNFSGKLINSPVREEIPVEVNEVSIIEFYSK